ncbi:MAG TPA: DUF4102 domain-containing protein [Novosphingobium capsulatum]|nr:DUF4102 domain-containing protein [Novosphingobium capsulatum]
MATGTITKRAVDAMKAGPRDAFLWDADLPGFGVKVTPAGARVYLFQYRIGGRGAPTRRYTIGKHGPLTPDQARTRAKALAHMVEQGTDPRQADDDALAAKAEAKRLAAERARLDDELVFEKVTGTWLEEYALDHRSASVGQARVAVRYMRAKLDGKPLPAITRKDLQAVLDAIPARQRASRQQVRAYMSILFGWALERGDIDDSPVRGLSNPEGSAPRDRVLSDDELTAVWRGTQAIRAPLGAFYRVLLLTGQRREEVAGMAWGELDRKAALWTIPASRAKNGKAHLVPLAPAVIDELDRLALAIQVKAKAEKPDATTWPKAGPVMSIRGGVSLSCFSQAKRLLDAAVTNAHAGKAIDPWRVHDLRRTLATGLQRLGVRFEVTEAVLNHVSGARAGVAGIYQRHGWADEKRAALEAWAWHVASILAPADHDNVVPIGAASKLTG